jgi:prephenate dehydrogenase
VAGQPRGSDYLSLAGPGFRDFTRIAASEPKMWRDILMANRTELLAQSQLFRDALATFEQAIATGDADLLQTLIALASDTRARWRSGAAAPSSLPPDVQH